MNFHVDGTRPETDQIFVFGSNLAGVHGAGAAALALKEYGAVWGSGIGHFGRSYAIPTKDRDINTLRLSAIIPHIRDFVQYTIDNPEKQFFVTRIGCGLAGYKDFQIAPYFRNAVNCDFPLDWKEYL